MGFEVWLPDLGLKSKLFVKATGLAFHMRVIEGLGLRV